MKIRKIIKVQNYGEGTEVEFWNEVDFKKYRPTPASWRRLRKFLNRFDPVSVGMSKDSVGVQWEFYTGLDL